MNNFSFGDKIFLHIDTLFSGAFEYVVLRLRAAKVSISFFSALSGLVGYTLKARTIDKSGLLLFFSVFLIACASATLNNLQDRHLDRSFTRTSNRPFANGALTPMQGVLQFLCFITIGIGALFFIKKSFAVLALGLLAVVCYNLLYTPLKTRTLFSVIPGVLCGMIPPMMGWVAAGGSASSYTIWAVIILFGIWQPPHAWLVILTNASEYRASRLKNILHIFSKNQIEWIIFTWACGFAAILTLLPVIGVIKNELVSIIVAATGIFTVVSYAWGLFITRKPNVYRNLFVLLNGSLALTILLCIGESIV